MTLSVSFLTGILNLKPGFSPLSILLLIIVLLGSDSLTQSPPPLPSPRRYANSPPLQREVRLLGLPVSRAAASLLGSAPASAPASAAAYTHGNTGSRWCVRPLRQSASTSRVMRLCAIEGSEGNRFVHYVLTLHDRRNSVKLPVDRCL